MERLGSILWLAALVACKGQSGTPSNPDPGGGCRSDDDCTISCASKGDCCNRPYCESPALASEARAAEAHNRERCRQEDYGRCPQIGARVEPDYRIAARCRAGACVADKIPRDAAAAAPAPAASSASSSVIEVAGLGRQCKTKADCRVVQTAPCDPCACPSTAIAAGELSRFQAAAQAIDCAKAPKSPRVCGECLGFVADCEAGLCVAKPER